MISINAHTMKDEEKVQTDRQTDGFSAYIHI